MHVSAFLMCLYKFVYYYALSDSIFLLTFIIQKIIFYLDKAKTTVQPLLVCSSIPSFSSKEEITLVFLLCVNLVSLNTNNEICLEIWIRAEYLLFYQRHRVWIPAPKLGDSQTPMTPDPRDLMASLSPP